MHHNRAYGYVPTESYVTRQSKSDIPEVKLVEPFPSDQLKFNVRSTSQDPDSAYYYIKDPVSEFKLLSSSKQDTKSVMTTKQVSTSSAREEDYTQMRPAGGLRPTTSDPSLASPESPMIVSNTLKRLSRFNSDQMEHLIEMLKTTFVTQPQVGRSSIPEQAAATVSHSVTPPPRPPKPAPKATQRDPATFSEAAQMSRERPSQLSLPTSQNGGDHSKHQANNDSHEHSLYMNALPAAGEEEESGNGREKEEKEVPVPTLVVEPTDEDSAPPVQRKKSVGLLTTAETANALKFKLGKFTIQAECGHRLTAWLPWLHASLLPPPPHIP